MSKSIISDMDGVMYRGKDLVPGANEFVHRLKRDKIGFLFLTNISELRPRELLARLEEKGIHGLSENDFITAAMATAMFLKTQKPGARVHVLGGEGLASEIEAAGMRICDEDVDYVVVGKTKDFTFAKLKKASNLVAKGARFIGTNPDLSDPTEDGMEPAAGALLAAIAAATGKQPYIVGKPNSLMMTLATRRLGVHPDDAVMIGDRLDTDIRGGMEVGMSTCLVLSGVSARADIEASPFRPDYVFESVADIEPIRDFPSA